MQETISIPSSVYKSTCQKDLRSHPRHHYFFLIYICLFFLSLENLIPYIYISEKNKNKWRAHLLVYKNFRKIAGPVEKKSQVVVPECHWNTSRRHAILAQLCYFFLYPFSLPSPVLKLFYFYFRVCVKERPMSKPPSDEPKTRKTASVGVVLFSNCWSTVAILLPPFRK